MFLRRSPSRFSSGCPAGFEQVLAGRTRNLGINFQPANAPKLAPASFFRPKYIRVPRKVRPVGFGLGEKMNGPLCFGRRAQVLSFVLLPARVSVEV
ncbi:MAG: hypothetical protein D6714_11590 [Bacteroidetes bacterium]|nr:MAG: hypothetical protein D6714_11590 [Bacteroidota bacterium]